MDTTDIVLRLLAATAAGTAIGANRDLRRKPIGMRTLGLVGLGSAVIALAGIRVDDLAAHADAHSRVIQGIIQGVMTGVSFIGAGVILRDRHAKAVHGLTTAATVWVTAALGVACGLADWPVAITGVLLALALLIGVTWLDEWLASRHDEPEPPP